jgi:UPF0716 protein FxsA
MAAAVLIALILMPFAEIAAFIQIGGRLGLGPTLGGVALAAVAGVLVLRHKGLATLRQVRESLDAGRFPVAALFDGACTLAAGALLLIPGFVTDALALLLFLPPLRVWLRRWIARRLKASGRVAAGSEGTAAGPVIDGEFERVDAAPGDARRPVPPLPPTGDDKSP